jgi:hypothetical protein
MPGNPSLDVGPDTGKMVSTDIVESDQPLSNFTGGSTT